MNSDFGIFVNENRKRIIDRKAPVCVGVCLGVFDSVNDSIHCERLARIRCAHPEFKSKKNEFSSEKKREAIRTDTAEAVLP